MTITAMDQQRMAQAIDLARQGWYTTTPNPRVGCVLAKGDEVVGYGAHLKAGLAHAEINALKMAGSKARGATAYVTLEPCSHTGKTGPCAQALIEAGISRVVIGMKDPNPLVSGNGIRMLQDAGIDVVVGTKAQECEELNPGFVCRMRRGTPRITLKMATSLDGRTALANGKSQWITSEQARADVHRFRAESCAVLSSAESVIVDRAQMNVRPEKFGMEPDEFGEVLRQPDRIILDGRCRLTGQEPIFTQPETLILVLPPGAVPPIAGVRALHLDYGVNGFDLSALLVELGRCEYNEVWFEAGSALAGAMVANKLVDRMVIYVAPKLMGHHSRGMLELPMLTDMSEVVQLEWDTIIPIGPDLRLIAHFREEQ